MRSIFMKALLKKWFIGASGVAALEFSLVGIPFVLMTVGILEMAMMFTAQSVLQESVSTASRLIRTGQLQKSAAGGQEAMFKDAVCDFAAIFIPCADIDFQVQKLDNFADASDAPAYDEDGNLIETPFDAGGANDVVMIRVLYNYPVMTPMMGQMLATRKTDNTRRLVSTIVLQAEPYE